MPAGGLGLGVVEVGKSNRPGGVIVRPLVKFSAGTAQATPLIFLHLPQHLTRPSLRPNLDDLVDDSRPRGRKPNTSIASPEPFSPGAFQRRARPRTTAILVEDDRLSRAPSTRRTGESRKPLLHQPLQNRPDYAETLQAARWPRNGSVNDRNARARFTTWAGGRLILSSSADCPTLINGRTQWG